MSWFGPSVAKVNKLRRAGKYDAILDCLVSASDDVVLAAFKVLQEDEPEVLKELITGTLESLPAVIYKDALLLLLDGSMRDRTAMVAFLDNFESKSPAIRAAALEIFLDKYLSFEAEIFERCLKSLNKNDKAAANDCSLKALNAEVSRNFKIAALKQLLADRESTEIRNSLQALLINGKLDDLMGTIRSCASKEFKEGIFSSLFVGDHRERLNILEIIGKIRWTGTQEKLLLLLDHEDADIRATANRLFLEMGGISKKEYVSLLSHNQEKIRTRALHELAQHPDRKTLQILLAAKTFPNRTVTEAIITAAITAGNPSVVFAESVLALEEAQIFETLTAGFCEKKNSGKWLHSEALLNAFHELSESTRLSFARLLLQYGQRDVVTFYFQEITGAEPPWNLIET